MHIFAANSKGPGYWKLDNSILDKEIYQNMIKNLIYKYKTLMQQDKMDSCLLYQKDTKKMS